MPHAPQSAVLAASIALAFAVADVHAGAPSYHLVMLDVPGARQVDELVVDPSDAKTLYALTTYGPTNYGATNLGLAKTVDGGAHWTRLPPDGRIANLVVDPRLGQTLYAGTDRAGVLRSTDGGTSWRPFGKGLRTRSVEVLTFDAKGTTLYAGTNGGGVVSIRVRY